MARENNDCESKDNSSDRTVDFGVGRRSINLDLTLGLDYNPNPNQDVNRGEQQISEKVINERELVPVPFPQPPPPNVDNGEEDGDGVGSINEILIMQNYKPGGIGGRQGSGRTFSSSTIQEPYTSAIGKQQQQQSRRGRTLVRETAIEVPYPWATDRRATIHSLETLLSRKIEKITGKVRCCKCLIEYQIEYDLKKKCSEVFSYLIENSDSMYQRAPKIWMDPVLPNCKICNETGSVKPVISEKKKSINWLFLLLDQTLGCCNLDQLKYFCKYTKNHRTGAKDRLVYLTYLTLCRQLAPNIFGDC